MLELFLEEVVLQVAAVVVTGAVILIAVGINRFNKVIGNWLGIDIAEWEVYHVAKALLKRKGDHDELFTEILQEVSYRLEENWGIKIGKDDLYDLIANTLEDLKKEEG